MAAQSDLELAERLLCQLYATQSQSSLSSQAHDCVRIVQALGYYDLADYLMRLSENVEAVGVSCMWCKGRELNDHDCRNFEQFDTAPENVEEPT